MGGPSLESHRAAEKRRQERRAALRTRDGVVDLSEWRQALGAVRALHRLLGCPDWFLGARVAVAGDVGLEIRVLVYANAPPCCVPTVVNDVPVRVVIRPTEASQGR